MKVLLVPSIRASMGSGHLKRAIRLAEVFGPQSALLLEQQDRLLGRNGELPGWDPQILLESLGGKPSALRTLKVFDSREKWDLVVVDRRSSSAEFIQRFFPIPVVGLDEGGEARRFCSYLVDTLPVIRQPHPANLSALSLLDLPVRRRLDQRPQGHQSAFRPSRDNRQPGRTSGHRISFDRVLISFGGEDPADLSPRILDLLLGRRLFTPAQVTVVQGPFFKRNTWPEGITVLINPADLKSRLSEYDLLFCSFGLTTYEALAAGVPVINFNPSRYHRRLSRAAGIPEIGVRLPAERRLRGLLATPRRLEQTLSNHPPEIFTGPPRLTELPAELQPGRTVDCPVCGRDGNPGAARFSDSTYFRCLDCGIIYQIGFGAQRAQGVRYDEHYFFEEYRKQYGKTYLEDFQTIKGAAAVRLKYIRKFSRNQGAGEAGSSSDPRLLDIGCAYGPFLQAAAEQGYRVQGLEVSEEAARYVNGELGLSCTVGDFSSPDCVQSLAGVDGGFDVLTMWYVIEHFQETAAVLRRVNGLLKRGGVFAFSTPSASGISARKNMVRFLENSPSDHYTIWPLNAVPGILRSCGFKVQQIVVTGHHGERFPWPGSLDPPSPIAGVFTALSRFLRLGDTFEVYAVKVEDPS